MTRGIFKVPEAGGCPQEGTMPLRVSSGPGGEVPRATGVPLGQAASTSGLRQQVAVWLRESLCIANRAIDALPLEY